MAYLVQILVIFSLDFTILLWRNDNAHSLCHSLIYYGIAVVATISQQVFGSETFYEELSLSAICCCALCNKSPDRHTIRIHGQM